MSNRHLLTISVPGFHKHIPCTSLNSSSFPLFDSLCLSDSVFVRIHPCFSRQGSLNDRSDSLSAFIVMWLCRFHAMQAVHIRCNLQCDREPRCLPTTRRIFSAQPLEFFQLPSLAMGVPLLVCQLRFREQQLATACHTSSPSSQRLSRPTLASHNSVLGDAQNCSCSIMMTNKDSLSHAARKRTDTVFSKFTKPNFLSKLRHWLSPSSTISPQFTRLSVIANSHFVHDLRCKTRKPTE